MSKQYALHLVKCVCVWGGGGGHNKIILESGSEITTYAIKSINHYWFTNFRETI